MRRNEFGLSQSTRDLVKELRQNPSAPKPWPEERILAILSDIRRKQELAVIPDLIEAGLSDNTAIKTAARAIIRDLVELLPAESFPLLDESLRRGWGYVDYRRRLSPENVSGLWSSSPEDRAFVCLVASHRNGYVRAEVLKICGFRGKAKRIPE